MHIAGCYDALLGTVDPPPEAEWEGRQASLASFLLTCPPRIFLPPPPLFCLHLGFYYETLFVLSPRWGNLVL